MAIFTIEDISKALPGAYQGLIHTQKKKAAMLSLLGPKRLSRMRRLVNWAKVRLGAHVHEEPVYTWRVKFSDR